MKVENEKKDRTAASQDRLNKLQTSIAAQVKEVRIKKEMKPKEVATNGRCVPQLINMIERDEKLPKLDTLHDIAEGMGYKVEVILSPLP